MSLATESCTFGLKVLDFGKKIYAVFFVLKIE